LIKDVEGGSEVELDPTGGVLEKTNDPVRIYLCEMGAVPLLTREGEVDIAKRIERGKLQVLKALSRSPIVIRQVLTIGKDLRRGIRSIRTLLFSMRKRLPKRFCRTESRTLRAASTRCKGITNEPASCPNGYRPFRHKRKHPNTVAAATG
jgi:RNA polymerase primary sigma factor